MVGTLIVVYLGLLLFFNTDSTRHEFAKFTSKKLSELFETKIEISDIEISLFNRVILNDVKIFDQNNECLLNSKKISARIRLKELLENQVRFRTILLLDTDINVYQSNEDADPNFQFIVNKLSNPNSEQTSTPEFSIGSLIITRAKFAYNELWKPSTPGIFNTSHVLIDNIRANINLRKITSDSINIRLRSLKANEHSGLQIKDFTAHIVGNSECISINNFKFELPNSQISSPTLVTIQGDWKNFDLKDKAMDGNVVVHNLNIKDLQAFSPTDFSINNNFQGFIDYNFYDNKLSTAINLEESDHHFNLNANSEIHFNKQKADSIIVNIVKLTSDNAFIKQVAKKIIPSQAENHEQLVSKFSALQLSANIRGNIERNEYNAQLMSEISNIGNISMNANYDGVNGSLNLHADSANLAYLFDENKLPYNVNFDIALHTNSLNLNTPNATIKACINQALLPNKRLKNINLQLTKQHEDIAAELNCNEDDNDFDCCLNFNTSLGNNQIRNANLTGEIANMDFSEFGFNDTILTGKWSSKIDIAIPQWRAERKILALKVDSMKVERDENFELNKLAMNIDYDASNVSTLKLYSDYIDIKAEGCISTPNQLKSVIENALYHHIPALEGQITDCKENINFDITAKQPDIFNKLLLLPVDWDGVLNISGNLNQNYNFWTLTANVNELAFNNRKIKDLRLFTKANLEEISVFLQGENQIMNKNVRVELSSNLSDDSIHTNILWQDDESREFKGNLNLNSILYRNNDSLNCITRIEPSNFKINNKSWDINDGNLNIGPKSLLFNNFILSSTEESGEHQQVIVSGKYAENTNDSLNFKLKNLDVGYVLDLIKFDDVLFDGFATGTLTLAPNSKEQFLKAKLLTKQFRFNNALLGDADIDGKWANGEAPIYVEATMKDSANQSLTNVTGSISPKAKGLVLDIDATRIDLSFLNIWVKGIVEDIDGRATGRCNLFGPFKYLDLAGNFTVNLTTKIPANGVKYKIEDGIIDITEGRFKLKSGTIKDFGNGSGNVSAELTHTKLKKFAYNLDVNANSLLLYDVGENTEMPFYATTKCSGTVNLNGAPGRLELNANVEPNFGSTIVYTGQQLSLYNADEDKNFIVFRDASLVDSALTTTSDVIAKPAVATTDMKFNISVNMNPNATLRVVMDPQTNSYINFLGRGMLNANYHNKGNFALHGTYEIEDGEYSLNIGNLIKKKFRIQPGGNIQFTGNTDHSPIDFKAVYTIPNASISDLNLSDNLKDKQVPVNCILNITGTPIAPSVNFELDLPTVSEDEKQMVRQLISTEEDLNMQIIYLLSFGRFYTYDYNKVVTQAESQNQSTVMANSFISSTLSSQLNEVLTRVIDTNQFSIGTNVSTGTYGWSDMEIGGVLTGRFFNNRLHFNGNFGYHENKYNVNNNANLVGDFNISYLLTPSGTYRIKAYSQNNDRYFTKSNLTTQGFGIQYQKDFNNFSDLLKFKKNAKKQSAPTQ